MGAARMMDASSSLVVWTPLVSDERGDSARASTAVPPASSPPSSGASAAAAPAASIGGIVETSRITFTRILKPPSGLAPSHGTTEYMPLNQRVPLFDPGACTSRGVMST